jgi:hypothetical protein
VQTQVPQRHYDMIRSEAAERGIKEADVLREVIAAGFAARARRRSRGLQ